VITRSTIDVIAIGGAVGVAAESYRSVLAELSR
jgi:hypothetical protein